MEELRWRRKSQAEVLGITRPIGEFTIGVPRQVPTSITA